MHGGRIIMNAEKTSSAVIQNKWRHFLMQRNMRMRIDLENRAATAIQKCFRGYRDCLQFVVMTFSIIQIQAAARSYRAKLQLKQLKREKDDLDRKRLSFNQVSVVIVSSSDSFSFNTSSSKFRVALDATIVDVISSNSWSKLRTTNSEFARRRQH